MRLAHAIAGGRRGRGLVLTGAAHVQGRAHAVAGGCRGRGLVLVGGAHGRGLACVATQVAPCITRGTDLRAVGGASTVCGGRTSIASARVRLDVVDCPQVPSVLPAGLRCTLAVLVAILYPNERVVGCLASLSAGLR